MRPYGLTLHCGYAVTRKRWKRLGKTDKSEVDDVCTKRLRHRARKAGREEVASGVEGCMSEPNPLNTPTYLIEWKQEKDQLPDGALDVYKELDHAGLRICGQHPTAKLRIVAMVDGEVVATVHKYMKTEVEPEV
jgi:hypothetical protein